MTTNATSKHNVAIIGGGIIGLTSGIRLLEAGFSVTIYSKEATMTTTSSIAAAMWHPGGADKEPLKHWCQRSLLVFKELSEDKQSGIKFVKAYELSDHEFVDDGLKLADDYDLLDKTLFPKPWSHGYQYRTARINVPTYLPYLLRRFEAMGGTIEQKEIIDLDTLPHDIIVNASGVGAKELVDDAGVYPIRGQIIRIAKPEHFPDDIIHIHSGETFTYIIPRDNDCILGGTYQIGDGNKIPDEGIAKSILERTSAFKPELSEANILEHKVGLRPGRDKVRLEREEKNGKVIIHNYGHGSVGHTLAWGCAEDVVSFAIG
jgi:D-amino-acid oxidase